MYTEPVGLPGELRMMSFVAGVIASRNWSGVILNPFCFPGRDDHRRGVGELDHFGIAQPVRRGNDDFVARLASGEDDVVTGMFRAAVDDDLRRLVVEAVVVLQFFGDGGAQVRVCPMTACTW